MTGKIKVLIADDHALMREGLRKILEMEEDIVVVGEAVDGLDAVNQARALRPHVVLMDINMPAGGGLAATRAIRRELPDVDVIVLTIHDDEEYVIELVNAGAKGYMLKDVDPSRLVEGIRRVRSGETFIPSSLMTQIFRRLHRRTHEAADQPAVPAPPPSTPPPPQCDSLTERELEILQQIVEGRTNKEIAQALFISEKTVKNHVSNILRKLDLSDRTQAAVYAIRHGLVRVS
ncbi:MAG: response regulator transcription factor [Clostridia bacterium]